MSSLILTLLIPLLYLLEIFIIVNTGKVLGFGIPITILGLIISFFGLIHWILGFINLGTGAFAVLPKAKKLITTGIYKHHRHPIYLGIILTFLGLSLSMGSWTGIFYVLLILIPLSVIRIKKEEKILLKKFSKTYSEYQAKTFI